MNRDIEELQKYYNEKLAAAEATQTEELPTITTEDTEIVKAMAQQMEVITQYDYTAHYGSTKNPIELIPTEEVDTDADYENVPMVYFKADGILAYEGDEEIIHDPDPLIGPDALQSFNVPLFDGHIPDEDVVYVRNNLRKKYYTITLINGTYREWLRYHDTGSLLYEEDDDE